MKLILFLASLVLIVNSFPQGSKAKELVGKMTLEEKANPELEWE